MGKRRDPQAARVGAATSAKNTVLAVLRAADRIRQRVTAALEPHDLTSQQYNVLRILRGARGERLPTLEIAARMIERSPGITRLLDRLEEKGLVARQRCRQDRRQVLCEITPQGLELLRQLDEPIDRVDEASVSALGESERLRLVELLRALDR
ncbi:MAG TPA: MarR family transcriptional regulator [Thermoanaerobaculia bacterium]|nr:MarR family transcriptional regulator [Thermoanaerobaculia bacterium]